MLTKSQIQSGSTQADNKTQPASWPASLRCTWLTLQPRFLFSKVGSMSLGASLGSLTCTYPTAPELPLSLDKSLRDIQRSRLPALFEPISIDLKHRSV